MRILIVGAGAIGGYFGARLAAASRDVTFLVRSRRAAQIRQSGLAVRSGAFGDLHLPEPRLVLAQDLKQPFDLILLSCKAYDLEACIEDIAPAVGEGSYVLPLLNGMRHMDLLDQRFGAPRVLGGLARISSTLDAQGVIHQFQHFHTVVLGARDAKQRQEVASLAEQLNVPGFEALASDNIMQDMWEKWVFIASAAAATSLMRASVGDILEAEAEFVPRQLMQECADIAAEHGYRPRAAALEAGLAVLTAKASAFTASMFRDIESGGRIEGDHIVGDLLARSSAPRTLLKVALAHLKSYEARRARESAGR